MPSGIHTATSAGRNPEPAAAAAEPAAMDRLLSAIVKRPPVTCRPSDSIESVLRLMDDEGLGSVIVTDGDRRPRGIFTLHDLLDRVAIPRTDLAAPVSSVMSTALIALPSRTTAYEAALEMVRQGIRHVIVVDEGKVSGIVSEKDLFDLQRVGLRQLSNEIKSAPDLDSLTALAEEIRRLAWSRLAQGVSSEQLTRFISSLNDLLTRRVLELELAGQELRGIEFCWLALGSEGRLEQTLATDQDNGLIFEAPAELSADAAREVLLPVAERVNTALAACGFPLCPGKIMARNPRWCLSAGEWHGEFARWIDSGDPEALLHGTIFFDFRALHGAERLAHNLRSWLAKRAAGSPRFLHQMAENALHNSPPLGLIRDFAVEAGGEHKGTIDLKINGASIFVDAARLFALATGGTATSTAERLRAAAGPLNLPHEDIEAWVAAFYHIQSLRLKNQQRALTAGGAPNRVNPQKLDRLERTILKESLRQAKSIQSRIALDYHV
jgi:CBS domain-containing protein